jgi:predicted metal-dependent hydrolase
MLETSAAIRPRRAPVAFREDELPRHWFGGDPVATAVVNALHVLFPAGERFFLRSVRHYLPRIDEPELRKSVTGFFGQEGSHAAAHESLVPLLDAQGYEASRFLATYEKIAYGFVERIAPPALRLATTAAVEHFTAVFAHEALGTDLLEGVEPRMRRLLAWHAVEELEHKAVAFDVLERVAPGYALRMGGLATATVMLLGFWAAGTAWFLAHEPERDRAPKDRVARASRRRMRDRRRTRRVVARVLEYARPGFHPNDRDERVLTEKTLSALGLS